MATDNASPASLGQLVADLYADAIGKVGSTFADLERQPLFKLPRQNQDRVVTVNATTSLREAAMPDIFTHRTNSGRPDEFWAKGLVVLNHRRQRLETLFWQTGLQRESLEVHHRDALAFSRLKMLNEQKCQTTYITAFEALAPDEWPNEEFFHDHQVIVQQLEEIEAQLEKSAVQTSEVRTKDSFEEFDLNFSSGFQFTAEKQASGLRIIKFDLDSSLTAAWKSRNIQVHPQGLARMIVQMVAKIDAPLRAFKEIGIKLPDSKVRQLDELARPYWQRMQLKRSFPLKPTP